LRVAASLEEKPDMNRQELLTALKGATAGERIVYHAGFLAQDRERKPAIDLIGDIAWIVAAPKGFAIGGRDDYQPAAGFGAGHLIQTRHDDGNYDYTLVMRRRLTFSEFEALKAMRAKKRKPDGEAQVIERKAA
jgi:hypothetical protein